jgi:hypothetical protein
MMRRRDEHSHPCATVTCQTRIVCNATIERNDDGWPEAICLAYDLDAEPWYCESCRDRHEAATVHDLREQDEEGGGA